MLKKIDNLQALIELKTGDVIIRGTGESQVEYVVENIYADRIDMKDKVTAEKLEMFNAVMLLSGEWWTGVKTVNPKKNKK